MDIPIEVDCIEEEMINGMNSHEQNLVGEDRKMIQEVDKTARDIVVLRSVSDRNMIRKVKKCKKKGIVGLEVLKGLASLGGDGALVREGEFGAADFFAGHVPVVGFGFGALGLKASPVSRLNNPFAQSDQELK